MVDVKIRYLKSEVLSDYQLWVHVNVPPMHGFNTDSSINDWFTEYQMNSLTGDLKNL